MGTRAATDKGRNRRIGIALGAAGAILVAGIGVPSLAAWTDQEWVRGIAGEDSDNPGDPGNPGAATFEVVQRATSGGSWTNHEEQTSANLIDFGVSAQLMTPGQKKYAWVELATTANSIAGDVVVRHGVTTAANDFEANLLWGAVVVANAAACSATAFVAPDADDLLQASQTPLTNSTATTAFHLDAAGANPVTVCFELELDEDAPESVMGLTGEPYWWFDATSIEP